MEESKKPWLRNDVISNTMISTKLANEDIMLQLIVNTENIF